MNISIIGLGKLGACMAATYASKGHQVIGVDINQDFVHAVNNGKAPVDEKDLQEMVSRGKERLRATTEYADGISNSDITFIIVPTPTATDHDGFSAEYVIASCKDIGAVLKNKNSYHLVVLTSTLLPGECEKQIIPVLEETSGKTCGVDFGFCYSPEFIAIGTVVHDLLNPDFLLVGESDARAGDLIETFYHSVSDNNAPVRRMSISSAELTKISVNSFLTMKITYANMLTEIAEHISGVDIDAVTIAIGSDKRIGPYYLRGGLGYGGPCFPRDNRAFAYMAKQRGIDVPYAEKTDEYNTSIISKSVEKIKANVSIGSAIAFLGLSYKPGTYFSEESQAIAIARVLSEAGYQIHAWNPGGNQHATILLEDTNIEFHETMEECIIKARVVFLANWDKVLEGLPGMLSSGVEAIIDPWRQFDPAIFPDTVQYIPFGKHV
jgi:UDPglucose 6-dehydrogenase